MYDDITAELGIDSIDECGGIPRSIVDDAIDRWCTKQPETEQASDRTREKYIERICDDLGLVESANGNTLTEPAGTIPACDLKSFSDLDRVERVEAVRVNLLRDADARSDSNAAQATAAGIQDYFDETVAKSTAHDLRNRAIDSETFVEGRRGDGDRVVKVTLGRVTDADLLRKAGLTDRAEAIEQAGDDEPVSDSETEAVDRADTEAEQEMQQLLDADYGTDGGQVATDGGHTP